MNKKTRNMPLLFDHKNKNYFFSPRILNIVVPHFVQDPFMALRIVSPFPFIGTSFASFISVLFLHFTQYPSGIFSPFLQLEFLFLIELQQFAKKKEITPYFKSIKCI